MPMVVQPDNIASELTIRGKVKRVSDTRSFLLFRCIAIEVLTYLESVVVAINWGAQGEVVQDPEA